MLLRSPTHFEGGFWAAYSHLGAHHRLGSTEQQTLSVEKKMYNDRRLVVKLNHTPLGLTNPVMRFTIEMWSYELPVLLLRHTSENVSQHAVQNLNVFNIMDFDIGGPTSYNDDSAQYEPESGIMHVHDDGDVHAALCAKPKADAWEISTPLALTTDRLSQLENNLEDGPRDIATGLQWNHRDLSPGDSRTIEIVLSAGRSLNEVKELTAEAWSLFAKRMQ